MNQAWLWIALVALAVVLAGGALMLRRRRRDSVDVSAPPASGDSVGPSTQAEFDTRGFAPTTVEAPVADFEDTAALEAAAQTQRLAELRARLDAEDVIREEAALAAEMAAELAAQAAAAAAAAARAIEDARAEAERRAAEAVARQQAAERAARVEEARHAIEAARLDAEHRAADAARVQAERAEAERLAAAALAEQHALAAVQAAVPRRTPEQTLVMIADDSKVVRVKTSRLLAKHQFRVVLAEDGAEAMRQIDAEVPDVLITDVEMPGVDGFELTRHMRSHPRTAQVPIIMVTSADDRLRDAAAAAGVTALLGKPFPDEALVALIERHANVVLPARAALD